MRFSFLAAAAATLTVAMAEDLLFCDPMTGESVSEAQSLGFTTKIVNAATWNSMTTADFAAFKALIIDDNYGDSNQADLQFLIDTKNAWGPAITGNIILNGADPSNHDKTVLIDNSIKYALNSWQGIHS